jgi:hypothetical protein
MNRRGFVFRSVLIPIAAFFGIKLAQARPEPSSEFIFSLPGAKFFDRELVEIASARAKAYFAASGLLFSSYGFQRSCNYGCFNGHVLWRARVTFKSGRQETAHYYVNISLPGDFFNPRKVKEMIPWENYLDVHCKAAMDSVQKIINSPVYYHGYVECTPRKGRKRYKKAAKIEWLSYYNDTVFYEWNQGRERKRTR